MQRNEIMKHTIKILSSLFALIFATASFSIDCFAADTELTINSDAKVNVGDKIRYTMYLADTKETIIGFQLSVFYDDEYLKLDKDSLSYEKFDGVVQNPNLENEIAVNWTNINSPADFSKKAKFMSMDFEVVKGGETDITQFVSEMYGDDMTYLKSYTWTYSITVNDEVVVSDKAPEINSDQSVADKYQGGIVNYIDGKGEENSPQQDDEHQSVLGERQTEIAVGTNVNENVVDVTKDGSSNQLTTILYIAAIVVIVAAVVIILIIRKKGGNRSQNSADNNEQSQ